MAQIRDDLLNVIPPLPGSRKLRQFMMNNFRDAYNNILNSSYHRLLHSLLL